MLSEENEIMDEEETKVDDANKLIVCDSIEKVIMINNIQIDERRLLHRDSKGSRRNAV